MIKVFVSKQSNFAVSSTVLKKRLSAFFQKQGIVSNAEVSVVIVGKAKMMQFVNKYLKDGKLHNVLSFTPTETKGNFVFPPDGVIHLGEIVICYPLAVKESMEENVLIDERVCELAEHGALHLLGIHHS